MNFDNIRRPIRVSLTPPTEPATPPNPSIQRDRDRWSQQVRMAALDSAVRHTPDGLYDVLSWAKQFEHYILTGETEEPKS